MYREPDNHKREFSHYDSFHATVANTFVSALGQSRTPSAFQQPVNHAPRARGSSITVFSSPSPSPSPKRELQEDAADCLPCSATQGRTFTQPQRRSQEPIHAQNDVMVEQKYEKLKKVIQGAMEDDE
jgi:hypothetical protein